MWDQQFKEGTPQCPKQLYSNFKTPFAFSDLKKPPTKDGPQATEKKRVTGTKHYLLRTRYYREPA